MSSRQKQKKRLSVGFAIKGKSVAEGDGEDPLLEVNDDEAEKKERRKSKVFIQEPEEENRPENEALALKKVKKATSASAALEASLQKQAKGGLSNEQLSNLYSNCIKLSAEGKINQKNTWELNLIDYIDDVLEVQQEDPEMTNFQAASVTLDASVKIYSYRVDSVHSTTYKVLGGLNMTERGQEQQEEGDGESGEPTAEGETKAPKKPKKVIEVGGANTLEGNLENISVRKFDLAFDVDPLFKKTSAAFDEGGARGLLLNHLGVYNRCELIFDSSDLIEEAQPDKEDVTVDVGELQTRLLAITDDFSGLEICPTFSHFVFSAADSSSSSSKSKSEEDVFDETATLIMEGGGFEMEDMNIERSTTTLQNLSSNNNTTASSLLDIKEPLDLAEEGGNQHDPVSMLLGVANPEDAAAMQQEASLLQEIGGGFDDDGDDDHVHANNERSEGKEEGVNFILTTDNEFSYFNPKVLQNWAGPNHWKYTAAGKADAAAAEAGAGKKRKKEPFYFNFLENPQIDEKIFAPPGRVSTTLSSVVLKKGNNNANTLPEDMHYDVKQLTTLFSKPSWRVATARRRHQGGESPWYQVPEAGSQDNDSDNEIGGGDYDASQQSDTPRRLSVAAPSLEGVNLISEPDKVEQIKIGYAKTAKFVDVRALKEAIWTELQENAKFQDAKKRLDKKEEEEESDVRTFTDVLEEIPQHVSPTALPDISVPFCFICLLHLANEKGLSIEQEKGNLKQLWIHTKEDPSAAVTG